MNLTDRGIARIRLGFGGALVLGWIVVAFVPNIFLPSEIPAISIPLQLPGAVSESGFTHWLGTDARGDDILLNLVIGTRATLISVFFVLLLSYLLTAGIVAPIAAAAIWGAGFIRPPSKSVLRNGRVLPTLVVYVAFLAGTGVPLLSAAFAVAFACGSSFYGLLENINRLKAKSDMGLARIVFQHAVVDFFDRCFFTVALLVTLEFLRLWIPTGWGFYLSDARVMMTTFLHTGLPYVCAIVSLLLGINLLRVESQKRLFESEPVFVCAEPTLAGDRMQMDQMGQTSPRKDPQ